MNTYAHPLRRLFNKHLVWMLLLLSSCSVVHIRGEGQKRLEHQGGGFDEATKETLTLSQLEQGILTRSEREQYSELLPWFESEQEKIEFLSLPNVEKKQLWIQDKRLWARASQYAKDHQNLISAQDIAIGMPQDFVRKSWGEPTHIEVSGNPTYKNERWKYLKSVPTPDGFKNETRTVYFESGRVIGWDTKTL